MFDQEIFTLSRPSKTQPEVTVTWCFPNSYSVGMASLGYQLVWWLLEQDLDCEVYRAFSDLQQSGWQQSELVGFTLSWELDYANVLQQLQKLNIEPLSSKRSQATPLVFAGGPVLSANPETFAEFFDVILLGDAEVTVPALLAAWKQARKLKSRQEQLLLLSEVPGLYVPSLYSYQLESPQGPIAQVSGPAVSKQSFSPPPDYVAHSLIVSPKTTWADMFLLEIVRSCPQECRFCLASYLTRPFRAAPVDILLDKIDLGLRHTSKIGLLGPSVTEHPQFEDLASGLLQRRQAQISLASVRVDSLTPLILQMLFTLGQKSVTMAIESGSERLRQIMKKNLTEEQILSACNLIAQSGLKGVKFYGIVGLPGELDEDLVETVRLMRQLKKNHKQLHFVFGVSSFVPKAQTPYQWSGRSRQCKQKLEYLRKHLSQIGIEVRPESHNWSDIQALLSRGDRRLTSTLLQVAANSSNLGAWRQALRHLPDSCPPADFYINRDIALTETLPWSHLISSAKNSMLERHQQASSSLAEISQAVKANS